jgi:hypothetical protein
MAITTFVAGAASVSRDSFAIARIVPIGVLTTPGSERPRTVGTDRGEMGAGRNEAVAGAGLELPDFCGYLTGK